MALTGPYYWDGTHYPAQDGKPVLLTHNEFFACCCDPCDGCPSLGGAGSVATATVAPAGAPCDEATGEYEWNEHAVFEAFCVWGWKNDLEGGDSWRIGVHYDRTAKTWCAMAMIHADATYYGTPNCPLGVLYGQGIGDDVVDCFGSGTVLEFDLAGVGICVGQSMHVTIAAPP